MRRLSFILGGVGVMGVVVVACGGSVTSVDGNKNTSSLGPTDQNQLCVDAYNYLKGSLAPSDLASLMCGFEGASTTTDPATCHSQYSACVTEGTATYTTAMNGAIDCTGFNQAIAQCNTTVATYTKCLGQEIDMMKSMEAQFPVCSPAEAQAAELNALNKLSSDCLALMQTCQGTFPMGGSGSSSSGGGGSPDGG